MNRLYNTVALTGMLTLALALSACSTWRDGRTGDSGSRGSTSSGATSSSTESPASSTTSHPAANGNDAYPASDQSAATNATNASGASGAAGATSSSTAWQETPSQRAGAQASASTTPNGTVISIEPLATSSSSGSSTSGATSGSASGSGAEQAYRITLRMDDGSTQVISQASTPTYRSGDRVNLSSGVISR